MTQTNDDVAIDLGDIASIRDGRNFPCLQVFRNNLLVILTVLGVIFGFIIGFGVRAASPSEDALIWTGE